MGHIEGLITLFENRQMALFMPSMNYDLLLCRSILEIMWLEIRDTQYIGNIGYQTFFKN